MRKACEDLRTWSDWISRRPEIARSHIGGRVLLINYVFPPTGGSAVQRCAKLVKYLPLFGWSTEVLTAGHDRFPWRDESLLLDVPSHCVVHRVAGYEPACIARRFGSVFGHRGHADAHGLARRVEDSLNWRLTSLLSRVGMADAQSLWVGPAARFAIRRHRRASFDLMISSGPPHFAHQVAFQVARRTGLPWVADVRDPLISDFDRIPAGMRTTQAMGRLEQIIMEHAAAVITTCPSLADDLIARYPQRRAGGVRCITNGFDRDDLDAAGILEATSPRNEECVFVAAGAFYGRREVSRIVEPLQRVLDRNPQWQSRVRLVIAGTLDAEQRRRWEQNRPPWLTLTDYLDHAAVVRLESESACSIIVVPACRHGRMSIPGKTFELLALPVHILALVPPAGDTAKIVEAAGASTVAPFEDIAGAAAAMERIIADHLTGRLTCRRPWSLIDQYDRQRVAAEFAGCLAEVLGRKKPLSDNDGSPSATEKGPCLMPDNPSPASPPAPSEDLKATLCQAGV